MPTVALEDMRGLPAAVRALVDKLRSYKLAMSQRNMALDSFRIFSGDYAAIDTAVKKLSGGKLDITKVTLCGLRFESYSG